MAADRYPALVEDLTVLFQDDDLVAMTGTRAQSVDGGHRRIETRRRRTSVARCGCWRGHWTIENRFPDVRDITFREDASLVHCGNGPQILAALRNTVRGPLRGRGDQAIAATRRLARRPDRAHALVLSP